MFIYLPGRKKEAKKEEKEREGREEEGVGGREMERKRLARLSQTIRQTDPVCSAPCQ